MKKTLMDRFVVLVFALSAVIGLFDATNTLPSFFIKNIGYGYYYKMSVLLLLVCIIYFLLRFNNWIYATNNKRK